MEKRTLTLAIAAIVVLLSVVLVANRDALRRAMADLMPALGLAEPVRGTDAAYAAYQNGKAETALRLSRPLAEQGDARARRSSGTFSLTAAARRRTRCATSKWFRRAADQGNVDAQFHLGVMHYAGRGVPQNFSEAARWFRLAADGGDARAQLNLGTMYFDGEGVSKSNVNAHMWLNLSAARLPASDGGERDQAARLRDAMAKKMTPAEIDQAQKLAGEWKPR